ncbi:putative porin [Mesonia sp. K7]|uniref:putative porin n=1 Tax=Mesonia sp. K7 TaxID=2218606 RepID=UPI000DA8CF6B|nr:putative porin [Mesonia sp. K7]PZD76513.1 hypothetical protein DNG35_11890 [Mesonia sp. K7]
MKNILLTFLVFFFPILLMGQNLGLKKEVTNSNERGATNARGTTSKREKPPITDYKIINVAGDTTFVDTTLTIRKDYKYNYIRKDNFGLLESSNIGQPFTELTYFGLDNSLMPDIGRRAKQFPLLKVEDIKYYHVPTPLSELFFKTTVEQGQNLDAFLTTNVSEKTNLFVGYRGLRSLGNYKSYLTSQGSFRVGGSYKSENQKYWVRTHFVSQDLLTEENGGLDEVSLQNYSAKNEDIDDRALLNQKFEDAESMLLHKRFFLQQNYTLSKVTDSTKNAIALQHHIDFTDKEYHFSQEIAYAGFGETFENTKIRDIVEYQNIENTFGVRYANDILGDLGVYSKHNALNYGYRSKLILDDQVIPNRINEDMISLGANYRKKIGGFQLQGNAEQVLVGEFSGTKFNASAEYELDSLNLLRARVQVLDKSPDLGYLLMQSAYKNYNWYNDFNNINERKIEFELKSKKFVNANLSLYQIDNYTYLKSQVAVENIYEQDSVIKAYQYQDRVDYLKLHVNKNFSYGKFHLYNDVIYQKASGGEDVFRTPDLVTRNTLLYEDHWFKKAMFLQTGFIFNYFSDFAANAQNAITGDYVLQNNIEIGNQYTLDFFFNAKVDQARLYFKAENLTTILSQNNNFYAPLQPNRDFIIRFGIVWNFFL